MPQQATVLVREKRTIVEVVSKVTTGEITINLIPIPARGWSPAECRIIEFARANFREHLDFPTMKQIANGLGISPWTVKCELNLMGHKQPLLERYYQIPFIQTLLLVPKMKISLLSVTRPAWSPAEARIIAFARKCFLENWSFPTMMDIARHFGVSEKTVKNQVHRIIVLHPPLERAAQLAFLAMTEERVME